MKKLVFVTLLTALTLPALAMPTLYIEKLTSSDPIINGMKQITIPGSDPFISFCIEEDTAITLPGTYGYTMHYTEIMYGGSYDGNPTPPAVNAQLRDNTKMIYSAYLNGDSYFDGMAYYDVRSLVWNSQEFESYGDALLGGTSPLITKTDNWEDVYVLNLWDLEKIGTDKYDVQSFMIRVPAPGAFLLGGLGVACVGWIKRRRML